MSDGYPSNVQRSNEEIARHVLAALRPEDAHLVPAWKRREGYWAAIVSVLVDERDEARARATEIGKALARMRTEVERLRPTPCNITRDPRANDGEEMTRG